MYGVLYFLCLDAHAQADRVFMRGEEGYQCFRIPAIVSTVKGTLLAFAEGRRNGCGDAGDIDLVLKRSEDGGKTWSRLLVVWDDAGNTCGNPAPVVDHASGKVILLSTWNFGSDHEPQIIDGTSKDTRRVFVMYSSDEGVRWTAPREITAQVKRPSWTWYATGPVNGIQLRQGPYKGRLVIPCDHIEAVTKNYYAHVIYSDDGGLSWQWGGSTPSAGVNESTVAEWLHGELILNMRNYNVAGHRRVARSSDGGNTWSLPQLDSALPEPVCQASLLSWQTKQGQVVLAFSNPADQHDRRKLTIRLSADGGWTWPHEKSLYDGPAAYSNLVWLPYGRLGCLFEAGERSPYEGIVFRIFDGEEWIRQ